MVKGLTIWFNTKREKDEYLSMLENQVNLDKFRFRMLCEKELVDDKETEYNMLCVPTGMKVVTVEKGEWQLLIKGKDLPKALKLQEILWPKHPIYNTGPDIAKEVREAFLPGLTTIKCENTEDGVLLIINPTVNADPIHIKKGIEIALHNNGVLYDSIIEVSRFKNTNRSILSEDLLSLLLKVFVSAGLKSPDFEWYPYPAGLSRLMNSYSNVFALGPGMFPMAMPIPSDISKNYKENDKEFIALMSSFSKLI